MYRVAMMTVMVLHGILPCHGSPSLAAVAPARASGDTLSLRFNYARFGAVRVYPSRGRTRGVVLLVSGDGGWDDRAGALAQRLTQNGAMVAGIDIRHYRVALAKAPEACVSPSADFENLSHYLQSAVGLRTYLPPALVGLGAGAGFVYATLAEAPAGLFTGALSIGFCPDLDMAKPLCKNAALDTTPRLNAAGGTVGVRLAPARQLPGKWIALQGEADTACTAASRRFADGVAGSEVVLLPQSSQGDAPPEQWLPAYEAAYARVASHTLTRAAPLPVAVADLPLIIVPATGGGSGQWFAVFLTGDGGWVGLDKGVSAELGKHGIPVVGWDSLKYFWSRRTPDGASHDLDRVVREYSQAWGRSRVLMIGYSQGADTIPFMINRLPKSTRDLVGFTALLGLSDNAVFEFHMANWLGTPAKGLPTGPELARWSGAPYLCVYGEGDGDAACAALTGRGGTALKLPGGHHFGGAYSQMAEEILSRLPPATPSSPMAPQGQGQACPGLRC